MATEHSLAPVEDRAAHGALVGWKKCEGGRHLQVLLQTVKSGEALRAEQIDTLHLILTQQQAVQLANFLYTVAGTVPPKPARRGLMRMLG